jgi:hypothetical protein
MSQQQLVELRLSQPGDQDREWRLMKQPGGAWNSYEVLLSLGTVETVHWLVPSEKHVRLWEVGFWSTG